MRTLLIGFALLLSTPPTSLFGQDDARYGAGSRLLSAGLIYQSSALGEFSPNICPGNEVGVELSAGILAFDWLDVLAFGRVHDEIRPGTCINGLVPPPPDSGTVSFTDYSGVEGYPYSPRVCV